VEGVEEDAASTDDADDADDAVVAKGLPSVLLRSRELAVAPAVFSGNRCCRLAFVVVENGVIETQACASFERFQQQRTIQSDVKRDMTSWEQNSGSF
jgi:hypothetical protein